MFEGMVATTELFTSFSVSGQYREAEDQTLHPRSFLSTDAEFNLQFV